MPGVEDTLAATKPVDRFDEDLRHVVATGQPVQTLYTDQQVVALVALLLLVGQHPFQLVEVPPEREILLVAKGRGRTHFPRQRRALGGHAIGPLVGQLVRGGGLEALVPAAVFVLASGDGGEYLLSAL